MARSRTNKHGVPRTKRPTRLQSAVPWLKQLEGNNVLRSYCKRYGVDWRCAAIELKQLGIRLDSEYLNRRELSERKVVNERLRRRELLTIERSLRDSVEFESIFEAYLGKDFAAVHAMECQWDGVDAASS